MPRLRNVVVALVTRTVRGIETEVEIGPADGMPIDCAVSLDNLRTVPRALLTEPITRLDPARMNAVCPGAGARDRVLSAAGLHKQRQRGHGRVSLGTGAVVALGDEPHLISGTATKQMGLADFRPRWPAGRIPAVCRAFAAVRATRPHD